MKAFWLKYRRGLTAVAAIVAVYAALGALGCGCPIKLFLGISCPGCGMTRACLYAVRFDFAAAFYHHPLWVLLIPFGIACFLLWRCQRRTALRALVVCGALLMLGVWLWRMLTHASGDVVVFAPSGGLIGRGIRYVLDAILK